jgi:hypothetical protein
MALVKVVSYSPLRAAHEYTAFNSIHLQYREYVREHCYARGFDNKRLDNTLLLHLVLSLCIFRIHFVEIHDRFRAAVKFCRGIQRHRGACEAPVKNLRLITYSGNKSGN